MSILKKDLKVSSSNALNSYFPVRTNNSEDSFDWSVAQGIVVRNLYQKVVAKNLARLGEDEQGNKVDQSLERFRELCKEDFAIRLDEPELWSYLEKMYFANDAFFDVAPESLLFKISSLSGSSSKNRLGDLFSSLMGGFCLTDKVRIQRNFLEQQVVDSLRSEKVITDFKGKLLSKGINERPYLPFLTDFFCQDIEFLAKHPKYFLEKLEDLLKLYGYLYTAQLALNIKGWASLEAPTSKPLYFIMENETASKERIDLVKNGHQKVSPLIENIGFSNANCWAGTPGSLSFGSGAEKFNPCVLGLDPFFCPNIEGSIDPIRGKCVSLSNPTDFKIVLNSPELLISRLAKK